MYQLPVYVQPAEVACVLNAVFTEQELDRLEALAAGASEAGGIGEGSAPIRNSSIAWLENDAENAWVFSKLAEAVVRANAKYFRFDLYGFSEPLQLSRYNGKDHGHYDWHQDFGNEFGRKLSLTCQLTDENSYVGGDLEIVQAASQVKAPRIRGSVVLFPSYQLHRVAPVTFGVRHSLVAWISGPAFR